MKKADLILICAALAAALAALGFLWATRSVGDDAQVVVTVDGTETARYSLYEEREVVIEGADGGTNTLVISDGEANVTDADCPDRLCVHQAAIRYDGQTIVCLPHRVVVSVESDEKMDVDGVAG